MEQNPPSQPASGDSVSPEPAPIRDLVQPALEEIGQRERDAQARDEVLRAAVQRLSELRLAAARDHTFDDAYQQAIDKAAELLRAERLADNLPSDNDASDS